MATDGNYHDEGDDDNAGSGGHNDEYDHGVRFWCWSKGSTLPCRKAKTEYRVPRAALDKCVV